MLPDFWAVTFYHGIDLTANETAAALCTLSADTCFPADADLLSPGFVAGLCLLRLLTVCMLTSVDPLPSF